MTSDSYDVKILDDSDSWCQTYLARSWTWAGGQPVVSEKAGSCKRKQWSIGGLKLDFFDKDHENSLWLPLHCLWSMIYESWAFYKTFSRVSCFAPQKHNNNNNNNNNSQQQRSKITTAHQRRHHHLWSPPTTTTANHSRNHNLCWGKMNLAAEEADLSTVRKQFEVAMKARLFGRLTVKPGRRLMAAG